MPTVPNRTFVLAVNEWVAYELVNTSCTSSLRDMVRYCNAMFAPAKLTKEIGANLVSYYAQKGSRVAPTELHPELIKPNQLLLYEFEHTPGLGFKLLDVTWLRKMSTDTKWRCRGYAPKQGAPCETHQTLQEFGSNPIRLVGAIQRAAQLPINVEYRSPVIFSEGVKGSKTDNMDYRSPS